MTTYFIGIDFGTAHTKACVRSAEELQPIPVVVNPTATGVDRFLLPSAPPNWAFAHAPKVILASAAEEGNLDSENRAIEQGARVVAQAIKAAARQTDQLFPADQAKEFMVSVGIPWDVRDVGDESASIHPEAASRYDLMLERALSLVGDSRVKPTDDAEPENRFPNERLAPLVVLYQARARFTNEGILLVDSGGWTTHMTIVRWSTVTGSDRYSQHGQSSTPHGMGEAVQSLRKTIRDDLRLTISPVEVIQTVMRILYRRAGGTQLDPRTWPLADRDMKELAAALAQEIRRKEDCLDLAKETVDDLERYFCHHRIGRAHSAVWQKAWGLSPRSMWWRDYRLFLLGGASRMGRVRGERALDPLARVLSDIQQNGETKTNASLRDGRVAFSAVVYPETDPRFLDTFDVRSVERIGPRDGLEEALPYLFVSAGYTWPRADWMPAIAVEGAADPTPPQHADSYQGSGLLHK
jgi:hypothetical protein